MAQHVNFDKQEVSSLHIMSAFLLRAFKPDIGCIHNVLLNYVSVKCLAKQTEDPAVSSRLQWLVCSTVVKFTV